MGTTTTTDGNDSTEHSASLEGNIKVGNKGCNKVRCACGGRAWEQYYPDSLLSNSTGSQVRDVCRLVAVCPSLYAQPEWLAAAPQQLHIGHLATFMVGGGDSGAGVCVPVGSVSECVECV